MFAILEEDDLFAKAAHSVYLCPPNGGSDEDSGGEENKHVSHMTRNQLLAEAEIAMEENLVCCIVKH